MTALRDFNGLVSWRNAENSLQSVNVTMPARTLLPHHHGGRLVSPDVPALDPAEPRPRRPVWRQRDPAVSEGSNRCDGGAPLTRAARKPFPGPYFLHLSRSADFSEVVRARTHSRMKSPTPERPYTTSPFAS